MPDSETKFLSLEEAQSKLRAEELKEPEAKNIINEKLSGFTDRQKKFALLCITHPHLTEKERYAMAGYKPNGDITPAGLKKIEGKLGELLLEVDISTKDLAVGIKAALNATKLIFRKEPVYEKGDSGRILCYKDKEFRVPDQPTRNKMLEMLIKSGNYLPQNTKNVKHDHQHTHTVKQSLPELRERQEQLKEKMEIDGSYTVEKPVTS